MDEFFPEYVDLDPHGPRTPGKEQVLCFPASIAYFGGFEPGSSIMTQREDVDFLCAEALADDVLAWVDREHAENDPSWLQVIPYVVVRRGREVFRYQRTPQGGEKRLHGLWSIGVGGHVHPEDSTGEPASAYAPALLRELEEETGLRLSSPPPIVAVIFEPASEVGRVHAGFVHELRLTFQQPLIFADPAVAAGGFEHALELVRRKDEFEPWSRLLLSKLF